MKKYVLLLMIISKMFAQTDTTDYSEYFPLAPGNTWQYFEWNIDGNDRYVMSTVTGDTIMPCGIRYYTMQWNPSSSISRSNFRYIRYDSLAKVFCTYIESEAKDTILFNLNFGDSVYFGEFYLGDLHMIETGYSQVGRISNYFTDYIRNEYLFCGELRFYILSKGIGLSHMSSAYRWPIYDDGLVAAKINGIIYGSLRHINNVNTDLNINTYFLDQNYPNPFNSVTKISYRLRELSDVNISIFDICGRMIINLIDEVREKGEYNFVWDAKALQSGIYMIKMEANNFCSVKKCVLVK